MSDAVESTGPGIYILDSCAYFRLARSIHPLLGQKFGKPPHYKLFVLKRMVAEYLNSPRLLSKFYWVGEAKFQDELKSGTYIPKGEKRKMAEGAQSFLRDYVVETYIAAQKSGPSPADIEALAVAFAIPGIVGSDDMALRETGVAFDIETISSVDLLEKLLSDGILDKDTIQSIADYWEYDKDLPMGRHGFLDKIKALLRN